VLIYYFFKVYVDLDMKIKISQAINSTLRKFKSDGQQIIKDFSDDDIKSIISAFKKQLNDFKI
tara:strand:+ start:116 stop:304 length:189 start_codon:yes stop_codon:yes gene_type:complete